jgi:polyhydroxyalkanoate synthesis regulator phasin
MTTAVPIERQIACVRREIGMRKRVYPGWVQRGKMTQEEADRQIEVMEAVQATLETLQADEKVRTAPGLF